MEDRDIINKILEIVAIIKYNGEQRDFIEKALKKFLIDPKENFSLESEIKSIFEDKDILNKNGDKRELNNLFTTEELFEIQDYILTIDASQEDLLFYLFEKYTPYDSKLKEELGVTITDIIKFSLLLDNIYHIDLIAGDYQFNENIFSSKENAYFPYNLQFPDENSRKTSEMASFVTKETFTFFLKKGFKEDGLENIIENIDILFDLVSFDRTDIIKDNKLRFQEKPLFRIDNENFILINIVHLLFGLPYRLDSLLNKYSWYTDNKGKNFERVVFKILDEINKNKRIEGEFFKDIEYEDGQLDGLINFHDISWFVECKGRIPRSNSFKGNILSVNKDIERGIEDAEEQALKAIKESEKENKIGGRDVKTNRGILIIVEGMYPNLNQNPMTQFKRKDENYPRYIISFLTLMEILRQYDTYFLKRFLEWRSDPEMPIYCMSELDYWDYFTSMQGGLEKKEAYDAAKRKNIKVIFNGKRFNSPKFIKEDDKEHTTQPQQ
ncbi:MAG: hypothetical protein ACP5NZ_00015 [Nanobdellota archaeon]